jgi:hypothetical protein
VNRNNQPERIDPVDLIGTHYEAVKMSDACRLSIQNSTRAVVAARRKMPMIRRAMSLAGVAAAIAVFTLYWHFVAVQPTNKGAARTQYGAIPPHGRQPRIATGQSTSSHTKRAFKKAAPTANRTAMRPAAKINTPHSIPKATVRLGDPIVVAVSVRQPVTDGAGKALSIGDKVRSGDTIRTGKGGRVALVTRQGSELNLDSNSSLVLTASNVATIQRGRLYCSNRDKEIARIDTPAGHVKLLGTVVDTNVVRKDAVAVTVVKGKVQLSNRHGNAVVDAGKRSLLVAFRPPQPGTTVDTYRETSWYHGRGDYQSDYGDIAYAVNRQKPMDLMTEIWATNADGTDKRRVRTLIGSALEPGPWVPGERWLSLDLRSPMWTTPDAKTRSAAVTKSNQSRRSVIDSRIVLLDAATGQTVPFDLPNGYFVLRRSFAPNAMLMAFSGDYTPDPNDRSKNEYGVRVYDRRSGKVSHVYSGNVDSAAAWAPDSRHIAIWSGEFGSTDCKLLIVDTRTSRVRDLGVQGAGASFSPDGNKIAYCGDFKNANAFDHGVPDSGNIFVLDLARPNAKPVRVSASEEGALAPHWSPDGRRIAYIVPGAVWVVDADGTNPKEIYHVKLGMITKVSWNPSGDTVFVTENLFTLLLVAADGSGVRRTISQMGGESDLPFDAKQQTDAAAAAIKDAVFEYAMGQTLSFEGDLAAAQHYAAAANTFAGLVWNYPLSGLAPDDTFRYADVARKAASRTDAKALHDTCKDRMRLMAWVLARSVAKRKQFPPDLQSCLTEPGNWQIGDALSSKDVAHVMMLGTCPGDVPHGATPYVYTPPAPGIEPKAGAVIVRCPLHTDECVRWDQNMASRINRTLSSQ